MTDAKLAGTGAGEAFPSIGETLLRRGVLTAAQVEAILLEQQRSQGRFGEIAVRLGFLSEQDVQAVLAEQFHFPDVSDSTHPLLRYLPIARAPFSAEAEAIRQIRAALLRRLSHTSSMVSLAVVGPTERVGKTYLAISLAVAFSQVGKRTLLINANLRKPGEEVFPGVDNTLGLSSILAGRVPSIAAQSFAGLPLLHAINAGPMPPNPLELLQEPALRNLLGSLRQNFDVVVVDTAAVLESADAQTIAGQTDACILTVRQNQTSMAEIKHCRERLEDAQAVLAGVVYGKDHSHMHMAGSWWQRLRAWLFPKRALPRRPR